MHKLFALFFATALFVPHVYADTGEHSPRFLVHLLDYLAKDYGGAVADGKIISQGEYDEQVEFCRSALETNSKLAETKNNPQISEKLEKLNKLILAKASAESVATLARDLQNQVIAATGLVVAPSKWPSLVRGQQLFAQNCVSCHGVGGAGDGPVGEALDPKPANFLDSHMIEISPFQAFNTIRMGVPGTGMQAFVALSDKEAWDLAFFVVSLRYQNKSKQGVNTEWNADLLKQAATFSDQKLEESLAKDRKKEDSLAVIASLRSHSGDDNMQSGDSLQLAQSKLQESLKDFEKTDFDSSKAKALKAYLEGIEPVEPRLRATDPAMVIEIETKMAEVRSSIEKRAPLAELKQKVEVAVAKIEEAKALLGSQEMSPWVSFLGAFAILMREGFEAVLLIIALLGVVRAAGSKKAELFVHGGWLSALGLGGVFWLSSGWLMGLSGASRETLEGIASIFAVLVLLVVGFWLHSRTEIGRWTAFIKGKVQKAVEGKNLFALASIAFIAVFREAIETVLFLRAIWLEGGQEAKAAMGAGVASSLALVIFFAWLVLKFSAKLPVRRLFEMSAVTMGVLAVILSGKGVHSLQETGSLSVTTFPLWLRFDIFGIYPTYETLLSQIAVAAAVVLLWNYGKRPSRPATSLEAQNHGEVVSANE